MPEAEMKGRSSPYDEVDEALDESLPCSDPPAWTCGRSRDRWRSGAGPQPVPDQQPRKQPLVPAVAGAIHGTTKK